MKSLTLHIGKEKDQNPLILEVIITPKNSFHRKMMAIGLRRSRKVIRIQTLSAATVISVSKRLQRLPNFLDPKQAQVNGLDLIEENRLKVSEIIAMAAKNKGGSFSRSDRILISREFTVAELSQVLLVVVEKMQLHALPQAISIMKGFDLNIPTN